MFKTMAMLGVVTGATYQVAPHLSGPAYLRALVFLVPLCLVGAVTAWRSEPAQRRRELRKLHRRARRASLLCRRQAGSA